MDYLARPVQNCSIHQLVGHGACSVRCRHTAAPS
jgi:hypothetical protein